MADAPATARPEDVGLASAGLTAIDAYVRAQVDAGVLAGAVTLVARHGRVCHVAATGMRDIASATPAHVDDIFRIFSMTKPVTAVALMMLWDEGLWQFDDPIERFLPEFEALKVLDGLRPDGTPRLVEPRHRPTMRELVTHTAGFGYGLALTDPDDPIDRAFATAKVWEARDLDEMVARIAACPLAYEPGTSWRYSIGMDLEGAIIERLSGQDLGSFLAERLFAPLGMVETRFFVPPDAADRLATLYLKLGEQPLVPVHNLLHPDYSVPPTRLLGGSGLVSTIHDYARIAQLLLDGGKTIGGRLLSTEAVQLIMQNHLPEALLQHGFVAGDQRIASGIGMGVNGIVFTDPDVANAPVGRGTYQWDGAAGTWFWIDPENDLIFVGMTQVLSPTGTGFQLATQRLICGALI